MKHTYTIVSHDTQFQRALIDFLNDYKMVEEDSVLVHVAEGDGLAEIERLRAIVDRLPTTADGVPVVPGMRLWTSYNSGRDVSGFEVNSDGNLTCLHFRDGGFDRCVWAHYSSREAADAAGGSDV